MILRPQMKVTAPSFSNSTEFDLGLLRNQSVRGEYVDTPLLAESLEPSSPEKGLLVGLCHSSTIQGWFREVPHENRKHLGDRSAKGYNT